jgi:crossover junction endodeoxyribonuclease RuvC
VAEEQAVTYVIGADPGKKGAIALIKPSGVAAWSVRIPLFERGKLAWVDASRVQVLLGDVSGVPCYVEHVHAMPEQGVSSSFNFGVGFGSLLAALGATGAEIKLVAPQVWKKALGLPRGKESSLARAREMFPDVPLPLKKDEGKAEALLIAKYGLEMELSRQAYRKG